MLYTLYLCPMTGSPRHTFPKAEKLKSRKQIDLLFREGKSFFAAPVKCYYLISKEQGAIGNRQLAIGNQQLADGQPENMQEASGKGETLTVKEEAKEFNKQIVLPPANEKTAITIIPGDTNTTHSLTPPAGVGGSPNPKAGFSVSKKNFKHSVDRNRIKRLLREAYRLHKHSLLEKLAERQVTLEVFFVFTDRNLPTFALVEEKMKYCIRRLNKTVGGAL